jgi:hypothetical protein
VTWPFITGWEIAGTTGRATLLAGAGQLSGEIAAFDTWVVLLFQADQPPLILADHAANLAADDLFAHYRAGLYRIDPFYAFSQQNPMPGLYRLDDVAPDSFRDTEYYRQYFSRNVGADELQFLLPVAGLGVLSCPWPAASASALAKSAAASCSAPGCCR